MKEIYLFLQNHSMLSMALIVVLILLFIIELLRLKQSAHRVGPLEATHLINHQNAVVLDIRSQEAFRSGHIIGAISLPLMDLEKKYKKIEKYSKQPIIIVCAASLESSRAASFLLKNSYNAHILAGGIRAWKEADMPLVKEP
jgi:rhodanese-related sulfurtransferase